jgi:hypothetical protein
LQQIGIIPPLLSGERRWNKKMLKSKQVHSIALGLAMLITGAVAEIKMGDPPQAQELTSHQLDVLLIMSHARDLPVETPPSP